MSRFWQRIKFALVIILVVNKKLSVAMLNERKTYNVICSEIWLYKVNNIVNMTSEANFVKRSTFQRPLFPLFS